MDDEVEIWFDTVALGVDVREKLWLIMADAMDEVLDRFYNSVLNSSIGYLLDNVDLDMLRQKQRQHWQTVVLHGRTEDSEPVLRQMHEVHKQIGLDKGRYVSSYLYIMNLFEEAILRASAGPHDAHRLISALQVVVAEDITQALGIYFGEEQPA